MKEIEDQFGAFEIYQTRRPNRPLISVVMSVYNGGASIETSARSILNQSFYDFEFIVVDDASQDASFDRLRSLMQKDERIVIIRNLANLGLTKSLIRGIESSHGKYIARQDADDMSSPHRLAAQLRYLPAYDFVCCRTKVNQTKISPKLVSVLFYRQVLAFRNVFVHGSFMFKRELYDTLGGYDTAFVYAQDYDFIARVVRSRYKIKYLKQVLYFSQKSPKCISRNCLTDQNIFAERVKQNFRNPSGYRAARVLETDRPQSLT